MYGNEFDKVYFKTYANKLTQIKHFAKKLYFGEALRKKKNNAKELWKLIKSVIFTKCPTTTNVCTSKVSVRGDIIDIHIEICNQFNNYFVNIDHDVACSAGASGTNAIFFLLSE